MKSILFFIESLDGGGAEGILENIVKAIDKSKFDVTVVSETDNERRTASIKSNSHHHSFIHKNLNGSKIHDFINKIIIKLSLNSSEKFVRNIFIRGKYDIEVAFCEGYATKIIGNSEKKNIKRIAWVHTDVINHPWSSGLYGNEEEERKCYEKYDAIICVSQTIKESFIKKYGMEEKIHLLYNIIDSEKVCNMGKEPFELPQNRRPLFLQCGSFWKVKGYDRMVRVCARLRNEGYIFSVIIMGIGYERDSIEELIDELNVREVFTLMDYQPNPYKYIVNSDAYVCSSYAEGYSTTVSEAIILGKPVITTECSGMKEIFGNRDCGIICENSDEGLYTALKKIMDNPDLLKEYKKESELRSSYFDKQNRIVEIEKLFEAL